MLKLAQEIWLGFKQDKCYVYASALTYYTLLSIVPVLAIAFGFAKGFGFEQSLESLILEKFAEYQEVAAKMIAFSHSLLEKTQEGVIAGVGAIFLFWTVFVLFGNIESAFNTIWKIKKSRSLFRKLGDYFAMVFFSLIFFVASSSATVWVTRYVTDFANHTSDWIGFPLLKLLHLIPFLLIWVLFTFLYAAMPNRKVPVTHALIAGVTAGTIYQLLQWGFIYFQIGVAQYGTIYGGFAALPLFLMWLQLSWLTLLGGAEFSYAITQFRDCP